MLGLEGYGSEGSEEDDSETTSQAIRPQPVSSNSQRKPILSSSSSNITKASSLEPSRAKSKRTVFTVSKPSKTLSDGEDDEHERAAKKPRLDTRKGAGSSSLLAILPEPSKAAAVPTASPRILGSAAQNGGKNGVVIAPPVDGSTGAEASIDFSTGRAAETEAEAANLLPPSLAKAKARPQPAVTTSEPSTAVIDLFSLGTSTPRSTATPLSTVSDTSAMSITSAPTIPNFEPPTPTPSDPYPGYYQLPSGTWAAYEPQFYKKYYESWCTSQSLDASAQKGFEGAEGGETVEIDAQAQLDLARKEREERKSLTANAGKGPAAPNMNIKPPKIGSRARTRHQLSALLTEAYENREALEEKIAQGRRNRKEAGNKYGF